MPYVDLSKQNQNMGNSQNQFVQGQQNQIQANQSDTFSSNPVIDNPAGAKEQRYVVQNFLTHDDTQVSQASIPNETVSQTNSVSNIVETSGPDFPPESTLGRNFGRNNDNVSQQENRINHGTDVVDPQSMNFQVNNNVPQNNINIWYYLDLTENKGASDLHLTVGYPPLLRIDSKLNRVGSQPLQKEDIENMTKSIMKDNMWETFLKDREIDFSIQAKSGSRYRVNVYFERGNYAAAFRLIPSKIKTISELGMPEILNDFARLPHGLILVTGPTGSGKSTTLAAMLNEINITQPKHIISIEDPIEYVYGKGMALVDQREIGRDTLSWQNALRSVLRQDPDVVLVGEMRDYETIAATVTTAETGHLVFATLHTNSAAQTVDRMIDVFPEHQQMQIRSQLASVLQVVLSQRLVPLIGGGRKAAIEMLVATTAIRNAIREGKTYQIDNIIQTSADVGMITLEKSLADMIRTGQVSMEVALEYTEKPNELKKLVQG